MRYQDFIERAKARHGERFDPSDLAPQFVEAYNSQARIEVLMSYGEKERGRVGVTTGWKPCFILMARVDSIGSSTLLGADDKILKIVTA